MEQIRISAKNLGWLAMPTFCPRCFWTKMELRNRLPWQIFPGIFASIDSYSKKITNVSWQRDDVVPPWLKPFGDLVRPVPVPHHAHFFVIDEESNVKLTGVPDEILRRGDGSFFIADYKTARFTAHQDSLMPVYLTQLNGYAYIAERTGFSPVTGIGLVYYEPQTDLTEDALDSVLLADGFMMPFQAKLLELPLEPETTVPPLLRRVREIVDLAKQPEGRDGCKDCERVDAVVKLVADG